MTRTTLTEYERDFRATERAAEQTPADACAAIQALAIKLRQAAWRDRSAANDLADQMDAAIERICHEHGLVNAGHYTTADLARGEHLKHEWTGYRR